ncbi:putative reverse transcriptase domain-containing protein [Tanacetum coccineum]
MSSDNASSTVTYTSISSDSNGPSWGIPLLNAGELPEMDPYEEVAQQGQAPPLSPAYIPGPIELDDHVPVEDQPYADDASPTAESPGHIADTGSMEEDSIDYPDEPEDDDEDPEEDPEENHIDDPADGQDGDDEPSDDDDDDDDTDDEDEEPIEDEKEEEHIALADPSAVPVVDLVPSVGDTEAFETDESAPTLKSPQTRVPFSQTRLRRVWKTVRPEPSMSASMEARIAEYVVAPMPPTNPAYDQAPLGHRATMIRMRDDIPEEDMLPRRRFVLTAPPPGCDVAESFVAAAARPPRVADRAEDVGYVRALQASEHRMMTSIEEVNLRVSYQAQVRRDIRLEIDVVRGQRTAYETELHEVRQAYLSSEARNRALLVRLETLETHMTRMEWQRQRAEDDAVRQMMHTHELEARAQIDTVEDTDSIRIQKGLNRQGANDVMTPESIQAMIDRAIQRNSTHTQDDTSQSSGRGLRRPVQPARICSYINFMKCQPLTFKGTEGVVGLSQWLKNMESVFHISGCAIDNQVKFAICTLLGDALTWWNGHVRTLGHDAAYAMTWGTLKKKLTDKYYPKGEINKLEIELWNLRVRGNDVAAYTQCFQELALMCTKFLADETEKVDKYISGLPDNIHGNVMSVRTKTFDDAIELANDLMDQKLRTYAERQNDNKRKADDSSRNNQQPHKKQNVARAYTAGPGEKKAYTGNLPLCTKCNYGWGKGHSREPVHPNVETARGMVMVPMIAGSIPTTTTTRIKRQEHAMNVGRAYALGGRDASPDSNVITSTFLLNNRYAIILFDTGADRSFVSNTFSALINITPTTLESHYDVELSDGKIIGVNTIIRGCTLNFMNHPFNIDLMPVPLGSFDVIIGMDWLTKYHGVIICDEWIICAPFGRAMLIFQANRNNQREES